MLLWLCFHTSVTLIESNLGGRVPLWHEVVRDIVESVSAGSIETCFQWHWEGYKGLQSTQSVCVDGWLGNTWPSQSRSMPGQPECSPGLQSNTSSKFSSWAKFRKKIIFFLLSRTYCWYEGLEKTFLFLFSIYQSSQPSILMWKTQGEGKKRDMGWRW